MVTSRCRTSQCCSLLRHVMDKDSISGHFGMGIGDWDGTDQMLKVGTAKVDSSSTRILVTIEGPLRAHRTAIMSVSMSRNKSRTSERRGPDGGREETGTDDNDAVVKLSDKESLR